MSEQSLSSLAGASLLSAMGLKPARGGDDVTRPLAGQTVVAPEAPAAAFAGMLSTLQAAEAEARTAMVSAPEAVFRIQPVLPSPLETPIPFSADGGPTADGRYLPATGNGATEPGTQLPPDDLLIVVGEPETTGQTAADPQSPDEPEPAPAERAAEGATVPVASAVPLLIPAGKLQDASPGPSTPSATTPATTPGPAAPPQVAAPPAATAAVPGAASAPEAVSAGAGAGAEGESAGEGRAGERHASERTGRSLEARSAPEVGGRGPSISFDRLEGAATMPNHGTIGTAGASTSTTAADALRTLDLPANRAHWPEPLAERLATLAGRTGVPGVNTADIRLHPPHLGQLEVRITLHHDRATLWVASASPDVRDALQQSLPRLDVLLDNLGIRLADAQVSDRSFDGFLEDRSSGEATADEAVDGDGVVVDSAGTPRSLGLLDAWA